MKATDFRIGNIIHWGDHFTTIDINMLRDFDTYNQGGLSGEPITEEWFLNLGFTKIESNYEAAQTFDYTHGQCYIHMADQRINFRGKGSVDFSKIDYVHQLQNLFFAVTGEELHTDSMESILKVKLKNILMKDLYVKEE